MLDYRIRTFLVLCETMNYRMAAEKLHITQPAVTQHIKYLEKYYDCIFFNYDGHKLIKTKEAEIFEQNAYLMNYQEKKLINALHEDKGNHLSIGATKTIGEFVITNQVANYLAEPGNYLSLEVDNTVRILEKLDSGELDFALIEGYFNRSVYESRLYRKEPFVGLCSKNHPFAGKTVSLSQAFKENILLREQGSGTREILERLLEEKNYSVNDFKKVTDIGNFGMIRQLVSRGCGITFAYAAVGDENDTLAQFRVDGMETYREFNYVYLRDAGAWEAIELFEQYK